MYKRLSGFLTQLFLLKRNMGLDQSMLETQIPPIIKTVPIEQIYGQGWLFESCESTNRPIPERLANCYFYDHDKLLAIPGYELSDSKYHIADGNHRLYSAYLRGWKTIRLAINKTYK